MRALRLALIPVVLTAGCGGSTDEPSATKANPTPSRVEITADDFTFEIEPTSVEAGNVQTRLTNIGEQVHQAGYYRLNDGVGYDDFVEQIAADDSLIPRLAEGGRAGVVRVVYPDDSYVRPGDELTPGTYAVICSIADPDTGKNHYELGMIARLEVK